MKKIEKSQYRFYIQIRQFQGIDAKQIFNELNNYGGKHAPSLPTVKFWYRKNKRGQSTFEDKQRSGRPNHVISPDNIKEIGSLIEDDPYTTYEELNAKTSISKGSINTIIHKHLKLRKITSRWVPYELTPHNKAERVRICKENLAKLEDEQWRACDILTGDESWFYLKQIARKQSNKSWVGEGQSPRTVVRQGRFDPKFMFTIFFKRSGVVHISRLEKGKTIAYDTYISQTLSPLVEVLKSQRPKSGCRGLIFHHDNARPHIHKDVVAFLKAQQFTMMEHPPYSPDLAPCDFWLFDYIKQRLSDHKTAESLHAAITKIVSEIPKKDWELTFEKWVDRMKRCIKYKGDYFEHLLK
jgi:[histone H3]-lysine36 N-dimethyltransferase SETMAR